jgi:formylglycine-generating enzyme required for sulfatase activity
VNWAGTNSEQAVGDYAWFRKNSGGETKIIGKKEPNSLGLYDMSGTVWDGVEDWYDKDYYSKSRKNNPNGPSSGASKVLRGGAWDSPVENVRVTDRHFSLPGNEDKSYGFRLVFSPP